MKLYAYLAAALALAGLLYFAHHEHARANAQAIRADNAEASIKVLAKARAHEQRIAQEASDGYQKDLARLGAERSDVPVVRLCRPARQPVPAAGSAALRPDAAGAGRVGGEAQADTVGPDIGAALIDYGIACEGNALQLARLQQWINSR